MKFSAIIVLVVAPIALAAPVTGGGGLQSSGAAIVARHIDNNVPSIHDQKFKDAVMDAHWYWRTIHCAQELIWDDGLAQKALDSVQACTKDMQHDDAGSNLSGVTPPPSDYNSWLELASSCVHGWHEEETKYPYGNSPSVDIHSPFLHFTQMVWRDTSRIGCAVANCADKTDGSPARIYCFYANAGNNVADGAFAQNVWAPVCKGPSKSEAQAYYGF